MLRPSTNSFLHKPQQNKMDLDALSESVSVKVSVQNTHIHLFWGLKGNDK